MTKVAGWLWCGTRVAKEMMDWSLHFDEDGTVGRDRVEKGQVIYWWQTGKDGGVMGYGMVLGAAHPKGKTGWYSREFVFPVRIVKRLLASPVHKSQVYRTPGLRKVFAEATRRRPNLHPLTTTEVRLLQRLCRVGERLMTGRDGSSESFPKAKHRGAGFGNPADNQRVERAAVEAIRRKLTKNGFRVQSVEAEKRGYDLLCAAPGRIWHVEVKGVSGHQLSFPITKNELTTAQNDPYFRIAVVTSALGAPKISIWTGNAFLRSFALVPLSFMATHH